MPTDDPIRASFVQFFGEEQAKIFEEAAHNHADNLLDRWKPGSSAFRTAVVICISFECFTIDEYRKAHGITVDILKIKDWIRNHANLYDHDGTIDYIALFTGMYDEYMPQPSKEH